MDVIFLLIGLILGGAASYLVLKFRFQAGSGKIEERNTLISQNLEQAKTELESERKKVIELNSSLSAVNADFVNLEKRLAEQKTELENIQERFTKEFENLANKIFDEKSQKFTEQNRSNLDDILKPLGERIKEFERKVNDVYLSETRERASLAEQLRNLHELNQQMTKEATNLTRALKGDSKTQGSWGEFILESILEKSGLVKDREYVVQATMRSEDGRALRPDVIIKLPENKSMVIDSKVSLRAYEQFNSADSDSDREKFLNEHSLSVRNHIKRLSPKEYQNLYGLQSLDFVLMFVPIEPAFAAAIQRDQSIFYEAFDKNIIVVSPTTLLATLRTIASIWKQEKQNRYALDIAKHSGSLYDKFVMLVDDLKEVGNRMNQAQQSYEDAMKKLYTGRGNIVIQLEHIKKLGAQTNKSIPNSLFDRAENNGELFED